MHDAREVQRFRQYPLDGLTAAAAAAARGAAMNRARGRRLDHEALAERPARANQARVEKLHPIVACGIPIDFTGERSDRR
jgi:hypothetical protein